MPEINPLTNDQIFLKKIAENTGSDYNTGDVSEINPLSIDQILLKEIAANTAGQAGDITELEEKVTANAEAIEATQYMISDAYDSTHTYNVGDYCIYEDTLYKCNTVSTTGTWDLTKWDAVTVADEVMELTERVNGLKVYKHGETYNVSQTKDLMFGYVNSTSDIIVLLPILIDSSVSDNQISVTLPSSFGIATISGIVMLTGISLAEVVKNVYGLQFKISCNTNSALVAGTPMTAGIQQMSITF